MRCFRRSPSNRLTRSRLSAIEDCSEGRTALVTRHLHAGSERLLIDRRSHFDNRLEFIRWAITIDERRQRAIQGPTSSSSRRFHGSPSHSSSRYKELSGLLIYLGSVTVVATTIIRSLRVVRSSTIGVGYRFDRRSSAVLNDRSNGHFPSVSVMRPSAVRVSRSALSRRSS